ncbi:MAG: hypothetical protein QM754_08110 [Tepidisphaeraceae bacterium]
MSDDLTIEQELTLGKTWRGRDAAGREVVLKRLPNDCLRVGRVHPVVAQRLMRLREAPVAGLAQMIGVSRLGEFSVTVTEWIEGRPMTSWTADEKAAGLAAVVRLVEGMHRVGLVHGAVAEPNVILQPDGRVRLIDPSPLLYDDPATDWADLHALGFRKPVVEENAEAATWHAPTLAAAFGLTMLAVAAAAGWAWYLAGQS